MYLGSKYSFCAVQKHRLWRRTTLYSVYIMVETMLPRHIKKEKKPVGRPKGDRSKKRRYCIYVYVDENTYRYLELMQQKTGLSKSTLMYKHSCGIEIKERVPKELSSLCRDVSGIGNNLNQLTHKAHKDGFRTVLHDLARLIPVVEQALKRISAM